MDGYKTYDTANGYGSRKRWRAHFHQRMTGDEAAEILRDQAETPHAILGVQPGATAPEIKKAFRALIFAWHPDRNPGREVEAEAMAKKIIAAYTALS